MHPLNADYPSSNADYSSSNADYSRTNEAQSTCHSRPINTTTIS